MRSTDWVLKPGATLPASWDRPRRSATLTVETGVAYLALVHAESIFACTRHLAAILESREVPNRSWGALADIFLASLQPEAFAEAFHAEIEVRDGPSTFERVPPGS